MIRTMKNVAVFITALVLVAGMVSCENWMIEKLLERNEPSGGGNGGGGGGSVERVEITNGPERGGGVGSALVIKTEVYPANATNRDVKWSSEDSDIADVVGTANGATVHLRKVGSTKIRVTPANGGKEAVCTITVIPAGAVVDVTGVNVYPASLLLGKGESSMLMAQVLPGHATDQGIEWKSSNEGVVSVENGMVRALAPGSATISATSASDSNEHGECVVTVNQFVFMKGGIIPSGYKWGAASTGTGDKNGDTVPAGSTISVAPFHISETEVRYELWYEVKKWGEGYGYKFVDDGRAGDSGGEGYPPTATDKDQPVTTIKWRDAVVWCNAYSEMTGKEAVYYDSTGATLLRDATAGTPAGDTVDKATQQDRNGYRLPTEKEWEYAARGGVPGGDGTPWAYHYAGTDGTDAGAELVKFAWYNRSETHPVREKKANSAGLYDMSGNVWEWCFDKFDLSTGHVMRGGSWNLDAMYCSVAYRSVSDPDDASTISGFRLVCR